MNLWFDECYSDGDFEAYCDLPDDWADEDSPLREDGYIWFKAYSTGIEDDYDQTARFRAEGYAYECLIRYQYDPPHGPYREIDIATFGASSREEAERLLQTAADAIYG